MSFAEFHAFTNRRYGNSVRTWFILDPEEQMKIGEKPFLRACEEIGFKGDRSCLWRYLDSDQTGVVTLSELDPRAAMLLAEFRLLMNRNYNGVAANIYRMIDSNRSG